MQNKIDNNQLSKQAGEQITDLWSTPTNDNLWTKKFKVFSRGENAATKKAAMAKVKAVITPHEGQSYNPKSSTHK